MMLGRRLVSGSGSWNMYGLAAPWRVEVSTTGVFLIPGGDSRDSRSSEIKCRMSEGLGKSSFNFFSGSSRMLGMILLIDGREKTNLHLILVMVYDNNNILSRHLITIIISYVLPVDKFLNIHSSVA